MKFKEYEMPDGKKAVFEYDENGVGKITLECMDDLMGMIADRPQGWIPCSERLPEEEGNYLVTFGAFTETINGEKIIFGDIDGSVSEIGYGCYERDIFWHPTAFGWYDLATATPFGKRAIIAWMPLPKPYTADRKAENSSEIPNNCEPQTERSKR